jgi:hypothetical protein
MDGPDQFNWSNDCEIRAGSRLTTTFRRVLYALALMLCLAAALSKTSLGSVGTFLKFIYRNALKAGSLSGCISFNAAEDYRVFKDV